MTETIPMTSVCSVEQTIVRTLLYFELFEYPLTEREIWQFAHCETGKITDSNASGSFEIFQEKLKSLQQKGLVFQFGEFFQTLPHAEWVERRKENNRRADDYLPKARQMAQLIARFPFIRAVFVSGSLSKHSMKADGDIDFFMITSPGKLWLARTLLVLFKKIFLLNSHKYFCVNYFIDTNHLEIEEKNLFTATEVITLLPLYGKEWYENFCLKNQWAWQQFPHFSKRSLQTVPHHSNSRFKRQLELLLDSPFGSWLDLKALQITVRFWKRKFKHLDDRTFDVALKSRRYVSKHHPLHFQKKVLEHLERRMKEMGG